MYNQTEAVLAQYDLEIKQVTKGRGSYICDTDKGLLALLPFRGSQERGWALKGYLEAMSEYGYPIEQIHLNREREVVTTDEATGERFLVKDYIAGTELGTTRVRDMIEASELLGEYHRISREVVSKNRPATFTENSGVAAEASIESDLEMRNRTALRMSDIVEDRKRHQRELVKVRNYIHGRKKKQEFESLYLRHVAAMQETAEHSIALLEESQALCACDVVCHGDCSQHNIVWSKNGWRLVNFENACYGWSTCDLAKLMRKLMEKNGWDIEVGMELVRSYERAYSLGEMGYRRLYGLLLFPEKFWKIANHYMNSNKAWISQRDIEKLEKVIAQEEQRLKFLEKMFQNK